MIKSWVVSSGIATMSLQEKKNILVWQKLKLITGLEEKKRQNKKLTGNSVMVNRDNLYDDW